MERRTGAYSTLIWPTASDHLVLQPTHAMGWTEGCAFTSCLNPPSRHGWEGWVKPPDEGAEAVLGGKFRWWGSPLHHREDTYLRRAVVDTECTYWFRVFSDQLTLKETFFPNCISQNMHIQNGPYEPGGILLRVIMKAKEISLFPKVLHRHRSLLSSGVWRQTDKKSAQELWIWPGYFSHLFLHAGQFSKIISFHVVMQNQPWAELQQSWRARKLPC